MRFRLRQPQFNPTDLRGRHIPDRYLTGLPPELQKQRIEELTKSRDQYGKGDFSELPTDAVARKMGLVKKSQYRLDAEKRGFDVDQVRDYDDMMDKVALHYLGAKLTPQEKQQSIEALKKVYAKGLAAWKSGGHRPGATARNWANARIMSFLVGGKGPRTADRKQFSLLPARLQSAILRDSPF